MATILLVAALNQLLLAMKQLVVALERADGFGILSTASVGPIISVLARGLCVEHCVASRAP